MIKIITVPQKKIRRTTKCLLQQPLLRIRKEKGENELAKRESTEVRNPQLLLQKQHILYFSNASNDTRHSSTDSSFHVAPMNSLKRKHVDEICEKPKKIITSGWFLLINSKRTVLVDFENKPF